MFAAIRPCLFNMGSLSPLSLFASAALQELGDQDNPSALYPSRSVVAADIARRSGGE
jgi:hypothetical protein